MEIINVCMFCYVENWQKKWEQDWCNVLSILYDLENCDAKRRIFQKIELEKKIIFKRSSVGTLEDVHNVDCINTYINTHT